MSGNLTSLEKLGKFPLLNRLTQSFTSKHPSSVSSITKDKAVINVGDHYRLITNHLLLEGVHFDLTYFPLKHLGYKAVAMCVSDIVSMNGVAEQLTVTMAVSSKFPVEAVEEIFAGIAFASEKYQVDLVSADITSSVTGLVIATTAVGKVSKDNLCLIKGAKPHDIICVTGNLGAAYIGLQVLNREKQVFQADPHMQPDLKPYQYLVQRQLKPDARVDMTQTLDKLQVIPTTMIDIADGLASDLLHIAKASQVGATIYEERLPIHQTTYETAIKFNLDPITCAVNGGEDYELLFTIDQKDVGKLENHADIHFVGHITDPSQGVNLVTSGGSIVPLVAPGWKGAAH